MDILLPDHVFVICNIITDLLGIVIEYLHIDLLFTLLLKFLMIGEDCCFTVLTIIC